MTHKVFLSWLIYIVVVTLIFIGLCYLGLPQVAFDKDHSHLTVVLFGMYVISEFLSARQAWLISREQVIADEAAKWLAANNIVSFKDMPNGSVSISNTAGFSYVIPRSETASHCVALKDMAADGNQVNQSILLDVLAEHLHSKVSIIEFVAGRVVWVGIFATILGVIMAFWPLLGAGMDVDSIRSKLGGFFSGIAVAFIPTAASFIFKIALDFGTKILTTGATNIVVTIARMSETKILPLLENLVRNKGLTS